MAHFILSAFADEASPMLDEQLQALREEGINHIELRGVDGKNCSKLTLEEADDVKNGWTRQALSCPHWDRPTARQI